MALRLLISAGEASGDLYASELARLLRQRYPDAEFFGCAGPRMQAAGVEAVVDSSSLAVVGLVEVLHHIPRIYGEFRKLVRAARDRKPALAILADSPDFHLRVAKQLRKLHIPVVYLVAPQVWAWRKDRLPLIRRTVNRLLCLFPFEEPFFLAAGVSAVYIGHPLTRIVKPAFSRPAFFEAHGLDPDRPLITLLPGSRVGEVARHLPVLAQTVRQITAERPGTQFLLASPTEFATRAGEGYFERLGFTRQLGVHRVEGQTWDAIAHATLVLAASGTVTVEAAMLQAPMVTFYKVTPVSWLLGKMLVRVPYYTMVNLVAGKLVVPELLQSAMTSARLSSEAVHLLDDATARERMREALAQVRQILATRIDPMEKAAQEVERLMNEERAHVS